MELEKVVAELNKRFAQPLPEFYERRIVFWRDEAGEFADQLEGVQLSQAKLVRLTDTNNFLVKKLLTLDDRTSNYLVYTQQDVPPEDDWFLGMKLYSEEFRADLLAMWLQELGLPDVPELRKVLQHYRKFLNEKKRRAKVLELLGSKTVKPLDVQLAILAAATGATKASAQAILRTALQGGLSAAENKAYAALEKFELVKLFAALAHQWTGYAPATEEPEGLFFHVLLAAAQRTLPPERLGGAYVKLPPLQAGHCFDLIAEWLHSEDREQLRELALLAERKLRLPELLQAAKVEELWDTECIPCVDVLLLKRLMRELADGLSNTDKLLKAVEKRRNMAWKAYSLDYYLALEQVANMLLFKTTHAGGFHTGTAEKLWNEYAEEYYAMDTAYRKFHAYFYQLRKRADRQADDLKAVASRVEELYTGWFMGGLAANWTTVAAPDLERYGQIPGVSQQVNFYARYVAQADGKVFVVVSDALRYEVAAELRERLQLRTGEVRLEHCEALLPTVTKYGMAALLPHTWLTAGRKADGTVQVLADGTPTDKPYRVKLLQAKNPASTVLNYDQLIGMTKAEGREAVKGMEVVYIYHDTVDAAGHDGGSKIFTACADAVSELENLVRLIINNLNGVHIIITADHGFLYTYQPLSESDKLGKGSLRAEPVEYERRYVLLPEGAEPAYLAPVKFFDPKAGLAAFVPRENIRLKKSGSAANFVHGGMSLQELMVPVLSYHHVRSDYKGMQTSPERYLATPVSVKVLSSGRRLTNLNFSLEFYQEEAVSAKKIPTSYLVYFTDKHDNLISDMQRVEADKRELDIRKRTFRVHFNLMQLPYDVTQTYYLVLKPENSVGLAVKEPYQIEVLTEFEGLEELEE